MNAGGFRAIFPNGNREDLLPLGLGPMGKLLPYYVRQEEEERIRELLRKGEPVIITGPPIAGKTRTMLEIAADLDPTLS